MIEKAVTFDVSGLKIAGQIFFPGVKKRHPAVCLCHGILSPQPPDPADGGYPALARTLCQQSFVSFIFNFRGTGASQGNLDMKAWTDDLKAAVDYLSALPQVDPARLALMGFSAGAAAATYVAAQDVRVSCLVLAACPARFHMLDLPLDAAAFVQQCRQQGTIRDAGFPSSQEEWVEGFRQVSPIDWIGRIAPRPLLMLHGENDELIPLSHARELYDKACEPKELVVLEAGTHRLRRDDRAMAVALAWLKKQLQSPPVPKLAERG